MEIIDISGPIYEGMWEYGFPHGHFRIMQMDFDYLGHRYKHEGFEGLIGMTGTYIETESAYHGYKKAIPTHKISLKKLVNVDAYVLKAPYKDLELKDNRNIIQKKDILKAEVKDIPNNSAILISTGYGDNWEKKDYIDKSPFFKKEALYYLLDKKPSILGSDFPAWENKLNPETHLDRLFNSNVILLFNCKNLSKVKKYKVKLIALPIKVLNVSMCPCRVVVIE